MKPSTCKGKHKITIQNMVEVNDILKLQKKNITCNVPYQHYKPTIEKGMKNTDAQKRS